MTIGPWTASSHTVSHEIDMCVDTAEWKSTYMVGVWSDQAGARLWEPPALVWNQQAVELSGVEEAVKMAAHAALGR